LHPEHAYVDPKTGYRSLEAERSVYERKDGAIVYDDVLDREPCAVAVELSAEGVEWLLEELDANRNDRFVRLLAYARDLAKVKAWDRAVSDAKGRWRHEH
jgi:hypothetical protein